jgi:hypothetical protein
MVYKSPKIGDDLGMVYWVYHICKNGILAATNRNKVKHLKTISARFGFCSSGCKGQKSLS